MRRTQYNLKSMDINTTYLCHSNHFDLISAIDKTLVKSPLTWTWRHVKVHQDERGGPQDIWETLDVECDHREKLKWKKNQLLRDSGQRKINFQDEMCRTFTNVPTRLGNKKKHGSKISTNMVRSVE